MPGQGIVGLGGCGVHALSVVYSKFRQTVMQFPFEGTSIIRLAEHVLETLFAGLAQLYLAAPLGFENL
jgi:hypothetical protein